MTLVSHVPKKNKAVILLSTMHHSSKIDEETKKSEINLYYNSTKGGVDTFDQMCHAFSTKRKTRRWPVAQFYNLIDAWNKSYSGNRRKLFLKELAREPITTEHVLCSSPALASLSLKTLGNLTSKLVFTGT